MTVVHTQFCDGVASIVWRRPERGNAFSAELVSELEDALRQAQESDGAKAISLTCEGAHFSTGFDLSDLDSYTDAELLQRFVAIELVLARVWASRTAVLAFAQGRAWGAGADLFCAARERWAHPDATFRFPGAQFGLVLGTRRLAARVGADTACRWIERGSTITACEALAAGLVNRVGTREEFARCVQESEMRIDAWTRAEIRGASEPMNGLNDDLANLVRSAARPGLKARIVAYRAGLALGARNSSDRIASKN